MPRTLTTEEFIDRAKKMHGNTYDYSLVEYKNSKTKVKIICPEHGIFEQLSFEHYKGKGCPKCKGGIKLTQKEFIEKAETVHDNLYDYSKVNYINSFTKVIIICKKHGEFYQRPNDHISQKQGCPECAKKKISIERKDNPRGWSYTEWSEKALKSKNFDSFKVYIIKCWNENEEFYKIGKTFMKLSKRFDSSRRMPYNYEIVNIFKGSSEKMSELEKQLQKENCSYKYIPEISFDGYNECFIKLYLNE